MGSQRRSSSSPKPRAGLRSSSKSSSSRRLRPTPPGAPRTRGPAPRQAMARAGGQRRRWRGLLQQTPPVCTGEPAARAAPSSGKGSVIRRQGRRGGSGRALPQLRATVWGIRRPRPGPKDRLRGSWLQAASLQPGAGRGRSASPRSPPARSSAPLSPPEPSEALEFCWAVAGRDGQRASPMAGRRGQRGAGPLCPGQGLAPARPPPSSAPPSRPVALRPASRLSLSSHPVRGARGPGGDGAETLQPGQPPPSLPGEKRSQRSRLPFPFLLPAVTSARGHLPIKQRNVYKEHGIWLYKDCAFKSGCVTLSKLLSL